MNKKKILMDCERMKYPNTGLYHYCMQLGKALTKNINFNQEELVFYVRESEHDIFGNRVSYLPQHSLHKFFMPNTNGINIWHSTYQSSQYYPLRKNMKMVLTIHDLNFLHEEKKSKDKQVKYLKQIEAKIKAAAVVVCISQFVLNDVKSHIDVGNTPISVIYNGCNTSSHNNINPAIPSVAPINPFLFTIGTIVDKKNFHVLPALLVNNNYSLVIAGITQSEAYKQQIIAEASKLKVADRLIFIGAITENDKNWYYQNCEAFVFPSIAEGFGLPVIEAMHFGKPVFLSTKTSLPEVGGNEAFYFESFEATAMQQVLEKGLANYYSDSQLKTALQQRAAMFNWDNTANKYLDVYRNLY